MGNVFFPSSPERVNRLSKPHSNRAASVPTAPREASPWAAAGFPSELLGTRVASQSSRVCCGLSRPGSGLGSEEDTVGKAFPSQFLPWAWIPALPSPCEAWGSRL